METEKSEMQAILIQLEEFHKARRQYLLDASALSSKPLASPSIDPNKSYYRPRSSSFQSSTLNYHTANPVGISLMIPPLPRIHQAPSRNFEQDFDEPEACCDNAYPIGSSTIQDYSKRRRGRAAKSAATSTTDLKNISSIR